MVVFFIDLIFYTIIFTPFVLPLLSILFLLINLILFIISCEKKKRTPHTFSHEKHKKKRMILITSAVIAATVTGASLAVITVFYNAIAYM